MSAGVLLGFVDADDVRGGSLVGPDATEVHDLWCNASAVLASLLWRRRTDGGHLGPLTPFDQQSVPAWGKVVAARPELELKLKLKLKRPCIDETVIAHSTRSSLIPV
jgi:hypothetical protein